VFANINVRKKGKIHFILGAFEKLRKATISFVMSVCPSVRLSAWNKSAKSEAFLLNMIFQYIIRKCPKYSYFIKIGQEKTGHFLEN